MKNIWETLFRFKSKVFRNAVWKKQFEFQKKTETIDIGWQHVKTVGIITVPIEIIFTKIRTHDGLHVVPLAETPHYKWIKDVIDGVNDSSSRRDYYDYSRIFFPEENPDEQIVKIKKLTLSIKEHRDIDGSPIVAYSPILMKDSSYHVILYDGIHRVSIIKALGYKTLKCHLVREKLKN